MCGIVGLIKNNPAQIKDPAKIFYQLLYADAVRGFHATGMTAITTDNVVHLWKKNMAADSFLQMRETNAIFEEPNVWTMIGHNRYATSAYRGDAHAHPFDHGKVTMVHNGVLRNYYWLNRMDWQVDSEAAAYFLGNCDNYLEALEKIEGFYAFAWYDSEEEAVYLARNEYRPMFIVTSADDSYTLFGSEPDMLKWIMERNWVTPKRTIEVQPGHLMKFEKGAMKPKLVGKFQHWVEPKSKKKDRPVVVIDNTSTTSGGTVVGTQVPAIMQPHQGKSIRRVLAEQAEEAFMNENGFWRGKELVFVIDSIKEQEYQSTEGTGSYGLIDGIPGGLWDRKFKVRAHKVDLTGLGAGVMCVGHFAGFQADISGSNLPTVWVNRVEPLDLGDLSPEDDDEDMVAALELDIGPQPNTSGNNISLPELESLTEADISRKEFAKKGDEGCCLCGDVVEYEDIEKMLFTPQRDVVCPSCTLYIMSDAAKLLN